jgi:hypothetical protein
MQENQEHLSPSSFEKPLVDIEKRERELNEIIPVLAHGLVRGLERRGLAGQVRVKAVAGLDWGVAISSENPTQDMPDVIIYPREYLLKDLRLTNARLRHEIGNLNYPIEEGLRSLERWCEERGIAPALITPLVQAIHEASVNYLEMENSYSPHPEENFKALYREEVNTANMAEQVKNASPYKQAVMLTLLYSLSQTRIIPKEHFERGLQNARTEVRELFDFRTTSVIDQAIRIASPQKQVHLIREYLWPKFSHLVSPGELSEAEVKDKQVKQAQEAKEAESAGLTEIENMHRQVEELQERLRQAYKQQGEKEFKQPRERKEQSKLPSQELSPTEQEERRQIENLLGQVLADGLQNVQEQIQKAQKQVGGEPAPQMSRPQTMEKLAEQAKQLQGQLAALQEAVSQNPALQEQIETLAEQTKQLESVAEYVSNPEEEIAFEVEPTAYNIKEYGIDEKQLTEEQKEILQKIRHFAQETSKVYRGVMDILMQAYQQKNPNFTDRVISWIKEKGYDLPVFSLYGRTSAEEFLQSNPGLGVDKLSHGDFLVNFNLPKPLARFWYKGGQGSKSIPVKEGEIEWGELYRWSMPVIWSAVDRAIMQGLYLFRLNKFGQHDYKKYYYLWEAIGMEVPKLTEAQLGPTEEPEKTQEQSTGVGSLETGELGTKGRDALPSEEQGVEEAGAELELGEAGVGAESSLGMPPEQEMQEFLSQMQEGINQLMEKGDLSGKQEAMQQMMKTLQKMQEAIESGVNPQDTPGELLDMMGELSARIEEIESQKQEGFLELGEGDKGQVNSAMNERPHDKWQRGGESNVRELEQLFGEPNPELLAELKQFENSIKSKFERDDNEGNLCFTKLDEATERAIQTQSSFGDVTKKQEQLETLEILKRQQQRQLEQVYREMSGLEGVALRVYIEYMEEMQDFSRRLKDFFIERFKLDQSYQYEQHQRRGARLERGWQRNIIGMQEKKPVVRPDSFERKRPPARPRFAWTLIIDNSSSCQGEIIEQEKRLAVALIWVAKELDIPFEIVTFGGPRGNDYVFLKSFEQDVKGKDLAKIVLLSANQRTPDVKTLEAAARSMCRFTDKFKRSYNFVYFMTDGESGSGSIQAVIEKYKRDMVITGIGLADAASTIKITWGEHGLAVPDVRELSEKFIRKIEEQIEQTFD